MVVPLHHRYMYVYSVRSDCIPACISFLRMPEPREVFGEDVTPYVCDTSLLSTLLQTGTVYINPMITSGRRMPSKRAKCVRFFFCVVDKASPTLTLKYTHHKYATTLDPIRRQA